MSRRFLLTLAILLLAAPVGATARGRPSELRLRAGTFRPQEGSPDRPPWYSSEVRDPSPRGRRYLVALTTEALSPRQREGLESAGAQILGYLPVHGYQVQVAPSAEASVRALPFVTWLGSIPAHMKVQTELAARAEGPGPPTPLRVVLFAGEPESRVLEALAGFGTLAAPSGPGEAWRVTATVPPAALPLTLSLLAGLAEVEAVELVRPIRALNQTGTWVHQSFVGPPSDPPETPIFDEGIYGCGQVIAVADTGQDFDSCFFDEASPPPISTCTSPPCPLATTIDPTRRKDIVYYNWSASPDGDGGVCNPFTGIGHGTHTSGSAAGDASPHADCATFTTPGTNGGDGQAPGAQLLIQEMGDGYEYIASMGGTVWNLADVAYRSGARIHSISWGGVCHDALAQCVPGCELTYDSLARDSDLAMWTYPDLLMVQAAGNEGGICPAPNAVVTPALAKSSLTVGSVGRGSNAGIPSPFTSSGPTLDGRLKPAVAAQGDSVISAAADPGVSGNCATCGLTGSSMSAPTAAGLAALAREYYETGFYASGVRDPVQGITPTGALLKATMIDGAVALGAGAPGPDFQSGYGRILLSATLAFAGDPFALRVDDHQGITTGSVVPHAFDVGAGEPLRFTLVWTDYPAALNAAVTRVNELKLEVTDPNGDVWFQTLGAGSGLPVQTMNPLDVHDARNVVERLVFPSPLSGRWIARVFGVDVPMGPQPFALLVRGDLTDCPAPAAPGPPTLSSPADGEVLVSWGAVPGAASYNVYRSVAACPGGPWVPVATGVTGTSFTDTSLSGGVTYSYYVAAASDAEAACESPQSLCASAVPTGPCTLAPSFGGVTTAVSDGAAACSVTVNWGEGTPLCGADVRYNVYRDTTPGFTPAPANRIARCLGGTSYVDAVGVVHGMNHYYVVRAEDAASGGGGPCRGGNEDGNTVEASAFPEGPVGPGGTWRDDAGDTGEAKFQIESTWSVDPSGGDAGPGVYHGASAAGLCADLTSPILTLGSSAENPLLTFSTKHDLELDVDIFGTGSLGQVEIATGPAFTNWTRVPVDYPVQVQGWGTLCPTTQAGFPTKYFSGNSVVYNTYSAISLLDWAGGPVKIRFHLSGDTLLAFFGDWWVDDIEVSGVEAPGVCTTGAAGPPPVPDGASVAGTPMQVSLSGSDVVVTWDAAQCPATAVNIYHGTIGDFTTFAGGDCDLPPTGSATLSLPDDTWFLVVATDGASTDGSWSRDTDGNELSYGGASTACPAITNHLPTNACP